MLIFVDSEAISILLINAFGNYKAVNFITVFSVKYRIPEFITASVLIKYSHWNCVIL